MGEDELLEQIFNDVNDEFLRATATYGEFNTAHEGFAVLKEECDELWNEVKAKPQKREEIRKEAIQVAAMAIRLIYDVCSNEEAS